MSQIMLLIVQKDGLLHFIYLFPPLQSTQSLLTCPNCIFPYSICIHIDYMYEISHIYYIILRLVKYRYLYWISISCNIFTVLVFSYHLLNKEYSLHIISDWLPFPNLKGFNFKQCELSASFAHSAYRDNDSVHVLTTNWTVLAWIQSFNNARNNTWW